MSEGEHEPPQQINVVRFPTFEEQHYAKKWNFNAHFLPARALRHRICFDGLALGAFLVPQLSTVAQSAKRMALRSVEILIRSIENKTEACHEAAPYTICLKESTSRPNR